MVTADAGGAHSLLWSPPWCSPTLGPRTVNLEETLGSLRPGKGETQSRARGVRGEGNSLGDAAWGCSRPLAVEGLSSWAACCFP